MAYYFLENPNNYRRVRILDYSKPVTADNVVWSEKEWEKEIILKTKKCVICEKEFQLPPPYRKQTCSKACTSLLYSKTNKGRMHSPSARDLIRLKRFKPIAAKKGGFEIFFPSIQASLPFFERSNSTISNIISGRYPSTPLGYSLRFL